MYTKVLLNWGAEIKDFDRGKVIKVYVNMEDLINKTQSWEVYISDKGYVSFDILEKKNKQEGKPTHYLSHSKKEDNQKTKPASELPF